MNTPDTIFLIDQGAEGIVWCDTPAPAPDIDPTESVQYVKNEWLKYQNEQPDVCRPCIFHIPAAGYPDYCCIGFIDETGSILDMTETDLGWTVQDIDSWTYLQQLNLREVSA